MREPGVGWSAGTREIFAPIGGPGWLVAGAVRLRWQGDLGGGLYAAGAGPMMATSRSIDCSTLPTRPNAMAAAQNATTSASSGRG